MKKLKLIGISLVLLSCTALAQNQTPCAPTDFGCSFAEGLRRGQQIRVERERAQAEQELMKAQAAAIRAQAEQQRLQTERIKQAAAVPSSPPLAAGGPPTRTEGLVNGRLWIDLPFTTKVGYLTGFI